MRDVDERINQPQDGTIDYTMIQELLTRENLNLSNGIALEMIRGGTKKIAQLVAHHFNVFGDTGPFETYCDVFESLLALSQKSEDTYNMFYRKSISILANLPLHSEHGETEIIDRYAELVKCVSMMSRVKKSNELKSILHGTKIDLMDEASFGELVTKFGDYISEAKDSY
ncbi:MAG: hypothetical protein GOV00_01620 [Candidatus Altiarchaeota archaeon]|nr:hypothetical protein [Candidatus Altiarchaeota archaeon]